MPIIRILLFPFSILYDAITRFRNHLFDIGYTKSLEFDIPLINVGNLTVGGTGKTPMVEYLIRLLVNRYKVATLSRGYGRKSKGFIIANEDSSAATIGDEPFQLYYKFKNDIIVSVGEERALAIPEIMYHSEDREVIILDDAYQHRHVKPKLNILLSDYNRPFFEDYILPMGRLREARKGANRADIVVISKCPANLDETSMKSFSDKVSKYKGNSDNVFFTTITYGSLIPVFDNSPNPTDRAVLVTGIANNGTLKSYLKGNYKLVDTLAYPDHHIYSINDVKKMVEICKSNPGVTIITTEKDAMRLRQPEFESLLSHYSVFYLPIETTFLKNGKIFDELVLNSIQ